MFLNARQFSVKESRIAAFGNSIFENQLPIRDFLDIHFQIIRRFEFKDTLYITLPGFIKKINSCHCRSYIDFFNSNFILIFKIDLLLSKSFPLIIFHLIKFYLSHQNSLTVAFLFCL